MYVFCLLLCGTSSRADYGMIRGLIHMTAAGVTAEFILDKSYSMHDLYDYSNYFL